MMLLSSNAGQRFFTDDSSSEKNVQACQHYSEISTLTASKFLEASDIRSASCQVLRVVQSQQQVTMTRFVTMALTGVTTQ
jgi:hypothetical protein